MSMLIKRVMINLTVIFVSVTVWAVDGTWIGAHDGDWSDTANWQGGAVASGADSRAFFADQTEAVCITNDIVDLNLQLLLAQGGDYTIVGNPVTTAGSGKTGGYGLYADKGKLTFNNTIRVNRATRVYVLEDARLTTKGALEYIDSQWLVKFGAGEWWFEGSCVKNGWSYLGVTDGTFRLRPGAVFTLRGGNAGHFPVGYSGHSGKVIVEPGAELNIGAFSLGYARNCSGELLVDGGHMTANYTGDAASAVIGSAANAHSTMSVSNNAVVDISNWLNVGASSRGELTLGSGANMRVGRLSLGDRLEESTVKNGPAFVEIDDATLTVTNQFVWRSSGSATRTNIVRVGNGQAESGRLKVPATVRSAANQSFAQLTLDGGTLEFNEVQDSSYNASLTDYLYGLDQFLIGRAGAVIDSSNLNATVTQRLQPDPSVRMDGGLIKSGSGMLTLAGGVSYAGATVVAQGILRLQGALPTGTMTVLPSAGLSLVDGQFGLFAPPSLAAGIGGESIIELEAGADNVCDSLVLPANSQLENVAFRLVGLNGASSYWLAGEYVIATYAGNAPDVSGWRAAAPTGASAAFEVQPVQKRVVMRVTGVATGSSVWLTPGSGVWSEAANWNTAPANDPGTTVLFGTAPGAAAHVDLSSAVTLGSLTFDAPDAYTLSGAGITFGSMGVDSALTVLQGAHDIDSHLSLPSDLTATLQPGASLLLNNGVSGSGGMKVTGGGTLMAADGAGVAVPLTIYGATLGIQESSTLAAALTLGPGNTTLSPSYGKTVTLSGAIDGGGNLTKIGSSVVKISGARAQSGELIVRNGTVEVDNLTEGGDLVIGEGTLKYTGADATTAKGLTIRTSTLEQGAIFETDANVILNGNIWAERGSFMKMGRGTVTLTGTGENLFGKGFCASDTWGALNRGAYGESPTHGFVQAYVAEGKLVLGAEGQTNRFTSTLIVGGETTFEAGAETAAHLEINGGRTEAMWIAIGRGNGSVITAPTGLVSSIRLNSGFMTAAGFWLGARNDDMTSIIARPLFEMNDGVLVVNEIYGGSDNGGNSQPHFVFNGGTAFITGTAENFFRLARGSGTQSELVIAGGVVAVSNTVMRLAEDGENTRGTLRLNGGRLITRGLAQYGAGTGEIFFNGGVLEPCQEMTLVDLSAATVQAGGFVTDVPADLALTVTQPLLHDQSLGATSDGGVVKLGDGTLTLGGANTYTGPTVVSNGTLRVTGTLAVSDLTLADDATLSLADGVEQSFAPATFNADAAAIELEVAADGSACDVLALPSGFSGALRLRLIKTGTDRRFVTPGRYPLMTFSGTAPETSTWRVEGLETISAFEPEGSTLYLYIGVDRADEASVWNNALGGAWSEAGNWIAAPVNAASASVLFGDAITAPATIMTGSGVTFGYMAVDGENAYTWSGGALTLGSAQSNALVRVTRGSHTVDAALAVPSSADIMVDADASLTVQGAISGAGSLAVTGGGTLILTNGAACEVPLILGDVTVGTTLSTVFNMPLTLGKGNAILAPAISNTVTVTSDIGGTGGLTKHGSSILALEGVNTYAGETFVRNGTLSLSAEPAGPLVIGEGTLKYTGADAVFARGYSLRTTSTIQAATIDTDADITFNGPIISENGAFIKLGKGTLTYACPDENVLNAGQGYFSLSLKIFEVQPYGDSPTSGYRGYNIFNGKVVMGVLKQTNRVEGVIVVGGFTADEPGEETAGHLEVNEGHLILESTGYIAIGRGNGTSNSAPEGIESTVTINGGDVVCAGFTMGQGLAGMESMTARPRFTLNGGSLDTGTFYCGETLGTPKPRIVINGGKMTVGPDGRFTLAHVAGCETEMTIAGGTVIAVAQAVRLADNRAGAQGMLSLDGGRLIADSIGQSGTNGVGILNLNGGVFQPSATGVMDGISAVNVQAGGARFDLPAEVEYTLTQPLLHDENLGGAADGGLVKSGPGTLVLAGANTYTGPTIVSNGVLSVMDQAAVMTSSLIVEPGGALALAMPSSSMTVRDLSLGAVSGGEAELSVIADQTAFSTGVVAVDGDLFLGKGAVTLLVRETSEPPSANGTYIVMTCSGTISGDAADLRLANGIFGKTYTFTVVANNLRLTVGTATENAMLWKHSTGGDWLQTANWVTAPGAGMAGLTIGFMDSIAASSTINIADEVTAGTLLFNNANAYTLSGAGSLTLASTNGSAGLNAQLGSHTVAAATELESDAEVLTVPGAELAVTGQVAGNGKLTKSGDGTLRLSAENTYTGGTEVRSGTLDVAGANALGSGMVIFDGGSMASRGTAEATVANDATVLHPITLATYAPLTLSGDWISSGTAGYAKTSSNELTVAGAMYPLPGSTSRMEILDGAVRFAPGAEALFTHETVRNSIDFSPPADNTVVRGLTIEAGAQVTADCLYVGYGATNTVSITGGTLLLQGSGDDKDALLIGTSSSSVDQLEVRSGSLIAADQTWTLIGVRSQQTELRILDGIASFGKLSLGVRDHTTHNVGAIPVAAGITVDGGLLEARQRWNWMAEKGGMRINTVTLNNGRLRLPATFASIPNRFNQSRLFFNGGVLETTGGGSAPDDPSDYLKGLKQAYVGSGGAVIDTCGRSPALAQRLTSQVAADGGIIKRGEGTLTLPKPCVNGLIDVQSGTLKLKSEEGAPYPDDPMVRLSFENGTLQDDSAYNNNIELRGSIDNLELIDGVHGTKALGLNGVNALYVNYRDDMKNADCYTVSAWVRQSEYQSSNQKRSFFGNMRDYTQTQYGFLLRIMDGDFRMIASGEDNVSYGRLIVDVVDALPLNTWKMLTLVVDGLNGFSMYVDGEKHVMRVNTRGVLTYTDTYGAGKLWMLQPTARTGGRAFNIGAVAASDTECFVGDLDDVTVYRRALNEAEIGMLYQAGLPFDSRMRVASGAALNLAGATQEITVVSGEGRIDSGTALVTGSLNPGDFEQSAAGALLTVTDNLTLDTNVTYCCDWTPEKNDLVDVWGTLTVTGTGTIDLGLTESSQMPGAPHIKIFPVMYYTDIVGAENFSTWQVSGVGCSATAAVIAADGVVTVTLDIHKGTLLILR